MCLMHAHAQRYSLYESNNRGLVPGTSSGLQAKKSLWVKSQSARNVSAFGPRIELRDLALSLTRGCAASQFLARVLPKFELTYSMSSLSTAEVAHDRRPACQEKAFRNDPSLQHPGFATPCVFHEPT
jgi:hypothetical protein